MSASLDGFVATSAAARAAAVSTDAPYVCTSCAAASGGDDGSDWQPPASTAKQKRTGREQKRPSVDIAVLRFGTVREKRCVREACGLGEEGLSV
ncbi:hypothetical protein [Salinibacter ruber]|uniref:hypothetical protein n=1 Tax=Salinibacter ruber TaxID=146919 RepID=UPI001F0738D7|nr:hypothetical protein [Salinibacter ruber]